MTLKSQPTFSPSKVTLANVSSGEEEVVNKAGEANTSMDCLPHQSKSCETTGSVVGAT